MAASMFCSLVLNNCRRAVKYASSQCGNIYCSRIPTIQFSDHYSGKISGPGRDISRNQDLSAEEDYTPKCSSTNFRKKRIADAEIFLNSLSEEMREKKLLIEFIIESLKTENALVPEHISALDMKIMITEKSASRKSVKRYLRQLCMKDNQFMKRKHDLQQTKMKEIEERTDTYMFENSIVCPHHVRQHWEKCWGKVRTLLHGHPVIIDMDYELTAREENVLQSELDHFLGWNQNKSSPFLLQVTSVHKNSLYSSMVESKHSDNIAAKFHQEHFTDLYPREKLVYLSPNGRPFARKFDRDKIYIIGGITEKYTQQPKASYIRAAELGIECRSFPVQYYFKPPQYKNVNTNFSIDVSLKILMSYLDCGSWKTALKTYIPAPKKAKP